MAKWNSSAVAVESGKGQTTTRQYHVLFLIPFRYLSDQPRRTSAKRTRSASIVSDRTHITNANAVVEVSPITPKPLLPPPPSTATTKTTSRAKRAGARKTQVQLQDVASVDGDEGEFCFDFPGYYLVSGRLRHSRDLHRQLSGKHIWATARHCSFKRYVRPRHRLLFACLLTFIVQRAPRMTTTVAGTRRAR